MSEQRKKFRVVFLDDLLDLDTLRMGLEHEGVDLEAVIPDRFMPYTVTSSDLDWIREETAKADYVIIANANDKGLERAEAVNEAMRADKACIVWTSYFEGLGKPYADLGYTTFLSRHDVMGHLLEYVKSQAPDG